MWDLLICVIYFFFPFRLVFPNIIIVYMNVSLVPEGKHVGNLF